MVTNKMLNRKKGKLLSAYSFAIIFMTSIGIVLMVSFFHGAPYDVRDIESHILMNQIADCVSYSGKINSNLISSGVFSSNQENFLDTCHLNFNSLEWEEEQFYAEVNFYELEDLNNPVFKIEKGNRNFIPSCDIQEEETYQKLAQCQRGSFYSTDEMNNQYIIKILAVVRKTEKNVKV